MGVQKVINQSIKL